MTTVTTPRRPRDRGKATTAELVESRRWSTAAGLVFIVGLAVVALLLPALGIGSYWVAVAYSAAFYIALAQSWNLLSGFTGYVSIAQGALAGLGSYTAVLASNAGLGYVPALAVAGLVGLVASVLIGLPSLRLKGIAFAIATVFFQEMMLIVAEKAEPVTRGPQGLAAETLVPLSTPLVSMVLLASFGTALVFAVRRTRLGLQLLALRDDELAAEVAGIRTTPLKLGMFAASASLAGVVGGVHGFYLATLFPRDVFIPDISLEALVVAMVGGAGSAVGPVVVGALYAFVQETLRGLGSALQLVFLGTVLLATVLFAREGVAGTAARIRRGLLSRRQERVA
ncbi:MAG: branched-chain amino acid ABC transporter permease [Egibacteraceae bacterium]